MFTLLHVLIVFRIVLYCSKTIRMNLQQQNCSLCFTVCLSGRVFSLLLMLNFFALQCVPLKPSTCSKSVPYYFYSVSCKHLSFLLIVFFTFRGIYCDNFMSVRQEKFQLWPRRNFIDLVLVVLENCQLSTFSRYRIRTDSNFPAC